MKQTHKVPIVRIAKRDSASLCGITGVIIRLAGLVLALVVSAFVIFYAIVHLNPLKVYEAMFEGNFGSGKGVRGSCLRDMAMLLCIGIGLAPAFKMRFWNIGAEGQILNRWYRDRRGDALSR